MKTKEELNELKNEVQELNKESSELTEEELEQIAGGTLDECITKLSNGMKISSSADDSSGFQISERMH